jgi:hypothetical protein
MAYFQIDGNDDPNRKSVKSSSIQPLDLPSSTWEFDAAGILRVQDNTATETISYSLPKSGTIVVNFMNLEQTMEINFDNNILILAQTMKMRDGSTSRQEVSLIR